MLDILIKNGTVYDGTGSDGIRRDVGVKDGKIVFPDEGSAAAETVDASGLAVTPGFIDVHTHADEQIYGEPSRASKLLQGNTTEIGGMCSFSRAPYLPDAPFDSEETRRTIALDPTFPSYAEYREHMERRELATNMLCFVGHRSIRASVLGMEKRPATKGEIDRIGEILDFGWQHKKQMAKSISNPRIDAIYEAARKAGATGGKISGAGGGGYMFFYCPGLTRHAVADALAQFGGAVRRYEFTTEGLKTWTMKE